jgi:hypothetical protein
MYAQGGHLKCAPGCVYAQELQGKNTVSCIDRVCSICHEKQEKERKEKLEADKLAAQKRAQQAEQRKQQQTKLIADQKKQVAIQKQKVKDNEMILVASTPKVDNTDLVKNKTKNTENSKTKLNHEKRTWYYTFDQRISNKTQYYYGNELADEKRVVALETNYKSGCYGGDFSENNDFTIIRISGGFTIGGENKRSRGTCGTDTYDRVEGVINRKGELIYEGKERSILFQIGTTRFFLEVEQAEYQSGGPDGCGAFIIDVIKGEKLATLSRNTSSEYSSFKTSNCLVFYKNSKFQYMFKRNYVSTSPIFTEKLNKIFNSGNYEVCYLFAYPIYEEHKGATAYFFGNDGSFKIFDEKWLTEYRDLSKEK